MLGDKSAHAHVLSTRGMYNWYLAADITLSLYMKERGREGEKEKERDRERERERVSIKFLFASGLTANRVDSLPSVI